MRSAENLKINGIINIDKPEGYTSHGCVSMLRRLTGQKRIGHGGTLDPMATGVLPVFLGRATRLIEYLEDERKMYFCTVKWGEETDTCDVTGKVTEKTGEMPDRETVERIFRKYTGVIEQVPPIYSALKVKGKKLYEYARSGEEVDIAPRQVIIEKIIPEDIRQDEADFSIVCSRGTYVRSLCRDMGRDIGCLGTMKSLRRTVSGPFTADEAMDIETLTMEKLLANLMPMDAVLGYMEPIDIKDRQVEDFRTGRELNIRPDDADKLYRVYSEKGFLGVGKVTENGRLKADKVFDMGE